MRTQALKNKGKAWLSQAFFIVVFVSACASLESRQDLAREIAHQHGFQTQILQSSSFPIYAAHPESQSFSASETLMIFIEGDGYAWANRWTPSDDPTPKNPLALRMATMNGAPSIYMARPCQYVQGPSCQLAYWTHKRFAPEIIAAYHEALHQIKAQYKNQNFKLVGYSGGAYIAFVLASERRDIVSVTSVAGLMEPQAWSRFHDLSPLNTSYDTKRLVQLTQDVSFFHICGDQDTVVPCHLTKAFIERADHEGFKNHTLKVVRDADHQSIWKAWPSKVRGKAAGL